MWPVSLFAYYCYYYFHPRELVYGLCIPLYMLHTYLSTEVTVHMVYFLSFMLHKALCLSFFISVYVYSYVGYVMRNTFGEGSGPIWLDDLTCNGSESSVGECRHSGWGVHNCGHWEDVAISCVQPPPSPPPRNNSMTHHCLLWSLSCCRVHDCKSCRTKVNVTYHITDTR